jgi:hypothetical protein
VVNGDTSNILAADAVSDALNITSDSTITLTKTVGTDTLNIAVNPVFDLRGSVFGDDSTKIIDAVENKVYGGIFATTLRTSETKIALGENAGNIAQGAQAVAIGSDAGNGSQGGTAVAVGSSAGRISQGIAASALGFGAGETSQGDGAIAIGAAAGATSQGINAVAVGSGAGNTSQGTNAVAIGPVAGQTSQPANTIILNATGVPVNGVAAQTNSFYVDPIRTTANGTPLMYNATTKEITYSNVLEFVGSKISTSDSSGLTVDVQTTFNSDVTVDNELTVTNNIITGRLKTAEIEGIADELNIYSDWAKDTGVSIVSQSGVESVTLTSNRIAAVVTNVGPSQKQWIFDTAGRIQFPDTRYQTGAAIGIADLKVLVAACADFAAFKTAIAALT